MNRSYLIFLIILLVITNLSLLTRQFKIDAELQNKIEFNKQLHTRDTSTIKNLKNLIEYNYYNIINTTNSPIFKNLNSDVVVLYIEEGVCGSCLIELFNYMEQLGATIGKDKLLLLGNFRNEKDFNNLIQGVPLFANVLFCNDINFLVNIDKKPSIFIIDKNNEMRLFYIPDYYPGFKEIYFTSLLPSYFLRE